MKFHADVAGEEGEAAAFVLTNADLQGREIRIGAEAVEFRGAEHEYQDGPVGGLGDGEQLHHASAVGGERRIKKPRRPPNLHPDASPPRRPNSLVPTWPCDPPSLKRRPAASIWAMVLVRARSRADVAASRRNS